MRRHEHRQAIGQRPGYVLPPLRLRRLGRGPPWQRPALGWADVTAVAIAIAQTVYEAGQFTDLPILGDALEDSGCTNEEALHH
jgi:hypothetical protein